MDLKGKEFMKENFATEKVVTQLEAVYREGATRAQSLKRFTKNVKYGN